MKKTTKNDNNDQLTIDEVFGESCYLPINDTIDATAEPTALESEVNAKKEFQVGAQIKVNDGVTRFCDGRGIPDYGRIAYIKQVNIEAQTVLIATAPDGKNLGVIAMSNVTLM